jgi:hypothetical protein
LATESEFADSSDQLDITPDPRVLVALTRTPIAPLDALCELIDNAIDAFHAARLSGSPIEHPLVRVTLPGEAEVRRGEGIIRVQDNGLGLSREDVANALRIGYTSKNPFDTLGLFGMGFNIATGKLGRRTKLITARENDERSIEVTLDLPALMETGQFSVPVTDVDRPGGGRGTTVEVADWWPEGDPNSGFVRRLASLSKPFLREQLGRRYATLLRGEIDGHKARIIVNDETCVPYMHCVWGEDRFVERQGWGRIPARREVDEVLIRQRRCTRDGSFIPDNADECPDCGRSDFRVAEERVWGWLGIQRFDDSDNFGIDLIRNGRAIRVGEKQAFFTFVDETTKREDREYPIDQQYGRIVGEVHLDHVAVDFQKQDFQRNSDEWRRAVAFLRGDSLIPSKWPEGHRNESPVSMAFQGYRKVRNFGRADMYMGTYNAAKEKADRIARSIEEEYYQRFLQREPGYFDDAKWWELVESATIPPIEELPECPNCGFQNLESTEECENCGQLLQPKTCVNAECGREIPRSALVCPFCASSQVPEVREPWRCEVCGETNPTDAELCGECESVRGTPNPVDQIVLIESSTPSESLSASNLVVTLADETPSGPIDLNVRVAVAPMHPVWNGEAVPILTFRETGTIHAFVDLNHGFFQQFGVRPEEALAFEIAQYLYELRGDLVGRYRSHSLGNLAAQVLSLRWADELVETPEGVREQIASFFSILSDRIAGSPGAEDFYSELSEDEQRMLAQGMIAAGLQLGEIEKLKSSGDYLRYLEPSSLVRFFNHAPADWFGGSVWTADLPSDTVGPVVAEQIFEELTLKFRRCLEDCASYLKYRRPERLLVLKARASLDFLEAQLA